MIDLNLVDSLYGAIYFGKAAGVATSAVSRLPCSSTDLKHITELYKDALIKVEREAMLVPTLVTKNVQVPAASAASKPLSSKPGTANKQMGRQPSEAVIEKTFPVLQQLTASELAQTESLVIAVWHDACYLCALIVQCSNPK